MKSGELRHEIEIQEKTLTSDGMGGSTETWTKKLTTRAAIWPIKGKEALEAMKLDTKITHRVRMRYRSGITSLMRISYDSRLFEIKSIINPDERNISLELLCEEENA